MSTSFVFLCFCKQKTAYDMRISYWSSDVCSSDLLTHGGVHYTRHSPNTGRYYRTPHLRDEVLGIRGALLGAQAGAENRHHIGQPRKVGLADEVQIGRASCRERVCQYV